MSGVVGTSRLDDIAVVTIDSPPVNALSAFVRRGLLDTFSALKSDSSIKGILLVCAGRTFVAGADISEFGGDHFEDDLNDVCAAVENAAKPVVAALHGTVLGGGLELALSCSNRIAASSTSFGFPEVALGLLPGAGGTQRAPRLIGAAEALDLILSGRSIGAPQALAKGLIDRVADGDLKAVAMAYLRELIESKAAPRRISAMHVDPAMIPPDLFSNARNDLNKRAHVLFAPFRIVDCVEASATSAFTDGLALERKLFFDCMRSPQSAALRHVFFAEREAGKIPGLAKDVVTRPVRKVGIVGAGTMGGGIAMNFTGAGLPVVFVEAKADALERGLGIIRKNYESMAAKGKMTTEQVARSMSLMTGSLDYAALSDCDLVIEAVFENMEIKKSVMKTLGSICMPGAIIASNTSTLDVDVLAQASGRPGDVIGLHFFSPANVMRLLEVVRGKHTAPDVLASAMALAKSIRKVAVVSGVCFGFIGNRMLHDYLRECEFLLLEGATPSQVDGALEAFGMAMGPCRMMDLAGVDVVAKVIAEQRAIGAVPADPAYRATCQALAEQGRYGQKTGAGYYAYDGRRPVPDPIVSQIMIDLALRFGIPRRDAISDTEIVERCLYPLINEGARILEEGIAYRAGDIDIVWINGYGFPAHKGGPMHMANALGPRIIEAGLNKYAQKRGNAHGYWTPAELLKRLAKGDKLFGETQIH